MSPVFSADALIQVYVRDHSGFLHLMRPAVCLTSILSEPNEEHTYLLYFSDNKVDLDFCTLEERRLR